MFPLLPGPCPLWSDETSCGHTLLDHLAWEAGWSAGLQAVDPETCTMTGVLLEAWLTAHSVNFWCRKAWKDLHAQKG